MKDETFPRRILPDHVHKLLLALRLLVTSSPSAGASEMPRITPVSLHRKNPWGIHDEQKAREPQT